MSSFNSIFNLYENKSLFNRFFIWGRWNICPFEELASLVPLKGHMAELGCGIGLFSNTVSLIRPQVIIDAYDANNAAIQIARKSVKGRNNINFLNQDVRTLNLTETYDVVAMIDVVHHIPREDQRSAFDVAWNMLKPGGLLIIKDVDDRPWWRAWLAYWHDMVQIHPPYLLSRDHLRNLIEKNGFSIEIQRKIDMLHIPHMAYTARKSIRKDQPK